MNAIHQLQPDVINKIAAGEVVERPASVVKELVENSIDAQADKIVIDIEKGGIAKIKISDNGQGISEKDIELSIQRHATSKISSIHDLSQISSMGFRGEALSSISSVSQFILQSKPENQTIGKSFTNISGEFVLQDTGMANGTIVTVSNLFHNIPARRKFLKSEKTEFAHIVSLIMDFALIHPEISFIITHNKKEVVHLPKTDNIFLRVQEVFGKQLATQMIPVNYEEELISISGYVTKPEAMQSSRVNQHIFVNNRPVNDHLILRAIRDGLGNLLPHDRHPAFFLHLQLRPDLVDVNVHPRKTEVKYVHNGLIFQSMERALWEAFNKQNIYTDEAGAFLYGTEKQESSQISFGQHVPTTKPNSTDYKAQHYSDIHKHVYQGHFKPKGEDIFSQKIEFEASIQFRLIGQVQNKYILIEKEGKIIVIDQHAAHEGLTYKQLLQQKTRNKPRSQKKLSPEMIELTQKETEILNANIDIFLQLGFLLESFGTNTFTLQGVPPEMQKYDIANVIKGMIQDIEQEGSIKSLEDKYDLLVKYASCRYAIMFQDPLSDSEMKKLVEDVYKYEVLACAHGRPVFFELDIDELAKKFHRH